MSATTSALVPALLMSETLCLTSLVTLFLKKANHQTTTMTDILYLSASIGFFALMLAFIWACEKV